MAVLALSMACGLALPGLAGEAGKTAAPVGPLPPQPGTFEAVIANNPISAILQGPKLWTTPEEPKDWVKASRSKEDPQFMPVGITPPPHSLKVRSAAELAATKADLDKSQAALQDQLAHKPTLTPITASPPSAATPPAAAPKKAADASKPKKVKAASKPKLPVAAD